MQFQGCCFNTQGCRARLAISHDACWQCHTCQVLLRHSVPAAVSKLIFVHWILEDFFPRIYDAY